MSGLCLVLSGLAVAATWLYERITTAPVVEVER
jgi:hypothetical protein